MKQYLLKMWMTAALILLALGGVWGQTVTYSPSNGAPDVSVSPVLSIEFDGEVTLNPGGSISVYNSDYTSSVSLSTGIVFPPNGPDTRLIINTNGLTIDLSKSSLDFETKYWVYISESALEVDGIAWNQLLPIPGEWSFTTKAAPTPLTATLSPADDATNVPVSTSNFVLTFSEDVKMADGEFLVRLFEKGASRSKRTVELDSDLINGNIVSIDFDFQFLYGKEYEIVFPANAIKSDATGALFPGLTNKNVWTFTTETAPPFWKEGYPSITNQTIDRFVFNAWADQEGDFYGVVTTTSSPPTGEDIEQELNGSARISFHEAVNDITNPTSILVHFNLNTALGNTYFLHVVYKAGGKYSEVATLQVDRVVPKVLSSNPAEGTIVFPVTESIEILFSEEVVDIDGDSLDASHFSFKLKDEIIPVDFSISVVTESEMTKVVLTPTTALIEDTTYTITISKVYDLSGNPSDPVSITFETVGVSTWTGGNSSNWSDPQNWGGVDFVQYSSVVIKSGSLTYPEITTGTIDVHNLTIQPGAVLTHTGGTLNVTGLFHLQSSDVVNATYLNNGGGALLAVGDSIRVDQVVSDPNLTYHISSPTNGATQLSIGATQGVFFFNNSTGAWESNLNDPLDPGVGYITRSSNDLQFRGALNFTDFTHTVYRSTKGYGWNLIGNPYTAMLDFSQIDTKDIEPTFWLWQNERGLYGTMNTESEVFINLNSTFIPSNHAFFVKVKTGVESTDISFSPKFLTANTTTYLKSSQVSKADQVKLAAVSSSGVEDETALAFISYASEGIDKYDSEKYLGGSANVLELFSLVGNNRLAINGMPLVETATIPLGYSTKTAGDYSIKVNTNTSESRLFLHDNVADVTEELLPGTAYSFNVASPGTNHSRFSLVVERVATGDFSEEVKSDVMKVMVKDRRLSVLVSPLLLDAEYYVVDMSGRILLKGKFNEEGLVDLGQLSVGSYVIQCNSRRSNLLERQKIVVY